MQAARKCIGGPVLLVELAAGMQAREHQFDHRRLLIRMHADRNAASVILNRYAAVLVDRDIDQRRVTGESLVRSVVNHFLDDVQRIFCAGIHAVTLLDRLKTLQYLYGSFIVTWRTQVISDCKKTYILPTHR